MISSKLLEGSVTESGTPIFSTVPHFSQVPIELGMDKEADHIEVRLYLAYHNFCSEKELNSSPRTVVSQCRIGRDWLHCSRPYVSKLTKHLEEIGWLTVIRIGQGHSNAVVLHGRKGEKLSAEQRRQFRRAAVRYFESLEGKV